MYKIEEYKSFDFLLNKRLSIIYVGKYTITLRLEDNKAEINIFSALYLFTLNKEVMLWDEKGFRPEFYLIYDFIERMTQSYKIENGKIYLFFDNDAALSIDAIDERYECFIAQDDDHYIVV